MSAGAGHEQFAGIGGVSIEALACGLPVAAFPVAGPLDILGAEGRGPQNDLAAPVAALDRDLASAIARALTLDRKAAAAFGARFSWEHATDQFLAAIGGAIRLPSPQAEPELA